ncbi:uncharacterized protein IWZ02DRAFT_31503 [Phyllosticta citriasiana]|uniref:CCHC-type domain-containing protein n=1 Tax=Phyllosticta citriasiana TaxID=595635 RepID=A0ABR1KAZ7_9PEZI
MPPNACTQVKTKTTSPPTSSPPGQKRESCSLARPASSPIHHIHGARPTPAQDVEMPKASMADAPATVSIQNKKKHLKSRLKCWECGKPGHTRQACFALHPHLKKSYCQVCFEFGHTARRCWHLHPNHAPEPFTADTKLATRYDKKHAGPKRREKS